MALGKQSAAFREQHNDLSVLLRRLIESAAEAVLFVSVQRKKKKPGKKMKRGRKRISNTREESHVIRVQHHGQRQTPASDDTHAATHNIQHLNTFYKHLNPNYSHTCQKIFHVHLSVSHTD